VLEEIGRDREPLVVTQNGEARAVLQDVVSYEQTQEIDELLSFLPRLKAEGFAPIREWGGGA
jgi:PHD/YefM family antitoxin component YafN of YafNO toxin-antitoxin module